MPACGNKKRGGGVLAFAQVDDQSHQNQIAQYTEDEGDIFQLGYPNPIVPQDDEVDELMDNRSGMEWGTELGDWGKSCFVEIGASACAY